MVTNNQKAGSTIWLSNSVWYENLIIIKFYSLLLTHLDKELMDIYFMAAQYCGRCCGDM